MFVNIARVLLFSVHNNKYSIVCAATAMNSTYMEESFGHVRNGRTFVRVLTTSVSGISMNRGVFQMPDRR